MLGKFSKCLIILFVGLSVYAEVVVSEVKVMLSVDISTTKLKWTNLGYGDFLVKVIVPELAGHTLLNHRNIGEDGPCLFTFDTRNLEDVIQGNPEVVDVEFSIVHSRQSWVNEENICKVNLVESIKANIRGFPFQHELTHSLPDRVAADCN